VELTERSSNQFQLGFAGDTFNTAYYLSQLSRLSVFFASAIGVDPYSVEMKHFIQSQNINTDYLLEDPQHLSGLYFVKTDQFGERDFFYYRENSAAKDFFNLIDDSIINDLSSFDILYTTGISLAVFLNKERLINLIKKAKRNQAAIYFDNNFRARLWSSKEAAINAFNKVHLLCDGLFVTFQDEQLLYDDKSVHDTIQRYLAKNLPFVVIKNGSEDAIILKDGKVVSYPTQPVANVTDTTGAGDSFNAACISGLSEGLTIEATIPEAHKLAAAVIQHQGALIKPTPKKEAILSTL
jgi:2-dehydro-3-deoxygluconokinase